VSGTISGTAAGLQIRPANADDLNVVVELRLALLQEHAASPIYGRLRADAPGRARRLFAAQLASPDEVTFLAQLPHAGIVGILRCVETRGSPLLYPDRYGYVSSVYVRPAHRREGVLRALLLAAEDWCRTHGLTEMRLHSVADAVGAGEAWDALGFRVVELLRHRLLDG
jgi:ribosomal protein S18 acetylase RimI-like enzyme